MTSRRFVGKRGGFAYLSVGRFLLILGRGSYGDFKDAFRLKDARSETGRQDV